MSAAFTRAIELFNQRRFFAAHEAWEEEWVAATGARRLFLQSLIHLAVAFHHHQQGNHEGTARQLRKGLRKLAGFLPEHAGLDTWSLYQKAVEFGKGAEYPRIELWGREGGQSSCPPL